MVNLEVYYKLLVLTFLKPSTTNRPGIILQASNTAPQRRPAPLDLFEGKRSEAMGNGTDVASGYVKIAIENGWKWPFIVDLPIKSGDFPWLC